MPQVRGFRAEHGGGHVGHDGPRLIAPLSEVEDPDGSNARWRTWHVVHTLADDAEAPSGSHAGDQRSLVFAAERRLHEGSVVLRQFVDNVRAICGLECDDAASSGREPLWHPFGRMDSPHIAAALCTVREVDPLPVV